MMRFLSEDVLVYTSEHHIYRVDLRGGNCTNSIIVNDSLEEGFLDHVDGRQARTKKIFALSVIKNEIFFGDYGNNILRKFSSLGSVVSLTKPTYHGTVSGVPIDSSASTYISKPMSLVYDEPTEILYIGTDNVLFSYDLLRDKVEKITDGKECDPLKNFNFNQLGFMREKNIMFFKQSGTILGYFSLENPCESVFSRESNLYSVSSYDGEVYFINYDAIRTVKRIFDNDYSEIISESPTSSPSSLRGQTDFPLPRPRPLPSPPIPSPTPSPSSSTFSPSHNSHQLVFLPSSSPTISPSFYPSSSPTIYLGKVPRSNFYSIKLDLQFHNLDSKTYKSTSKNIKNAIKETILVSSKADLNDFYSFDCQCLTNYTTCSAIFISVHASVIRLLHEEFMSGQFVTQYNEMISYYSSIYLINKVLNNALELTSAHSQANFFLPNYNKEEKLGVAELAGIVIGSFIAFALLILLVIYILRKKSSAKVYLNTKLIFYSSQNRA